MKRPATREMIVGHPVIALPMRAACGLMLLAALYQGNVFIGIMSSVVLAAVHRAAQQASAYRSWKAEWDSFDDRPRRVTATPGAIIGVLLVAISILLIAGRPELIGYGAGFAAHWLLAHPIAFVPPCLLGLAVLFRFVRHWPRRTKAGLPVAIVARSVIPVPSLVNAYRALPPYCQALLRDGN